MSRKELGHGIRATQLAPQWPCTFESRHGQSSRCMRRTTQANRTGVRTLDTQPRPFAMRTSARILARGSRFEIRAVTPWSARRTQRGIGNTSTDHFTQLPRVPYGCRNSSGLAGQMLALGASKVDRPVALIRICRESNPNYRECRVEHFGAIGGIVQDEPK